MSLSQTQSVPSTDEYNKSMQQELKKRLDEGGKTLQDILATCARNINIACTKGDRVSFVGDITDVLHLCEATWRISGYLEGFDRNYRLAPTTILTVMARIGLALNWVRNKLGPSTLATCCFHLYYDLEAAAKNGIILLTADSTVRKNLSFLENVFQSLLRSHNIMIVLFRKGYSGIWLSDDPIQSLTLYEVFLAKGLELQHENRGRITPSRGDFDTTSANVRLQEFSQDYLLHVARKVQTNLNSSLNTQPLVADYRLVDFYEQALLQKVAVRNDPQIQLGPVDSSCAFVVCSSTGQDYTIIHASNAFEQLTGYRESEIQGRNCRFLQAPDGHLESGVQKQSANSQSLRELKHQIAQGHEYQLTLINYKKGGQPFANLLTVAPVLVTIGAALEKRIRYYIGFLIDIAERPGCILGKNANGTYCVNYSTNQVPGPVDTAITPTDSPAPVLLSNEPVKPTELTSIMSPEADSPWTVTDGPAPPYALSPGVFYHTSRMGMLSP